MEESTPATVQLLTREAGTIDVALGALPGAPLIGCCTSLRRDEHPALVYLSRLSVASRRPQRHALDVIADLLLSGSDAEALPWHALRYQHTTAVRTALAARYAPATANRALAAMRGVLKEAWRLGFMTAEGYQRAADVERVGGERLPAGRELGGGELRRLFASCAEDEVPSRGARDSAVLSLAYGSGLRRHEVALLDLTAYSPGSGTVRVIGKGNKERLTHLPSGGAAVLDQWLQYRGSAPGALICRVSQRGEVRPGSTLTAQSIYDLLRRRATKAGVGAFSPHDLRRTFIGDLLDAGADLSAVQQLAGHASPTTTSRYDRRGERAKARAAGLLHLPVITVAGTHFG